MGIVILDNVERYLEDDPRLDPTLRWEPWMADMLPVHHRFVWVLRTAVVIDRPSGDVWRLRRGEACYQRGVEEERALVKRAGFI